MITKSVIPIAASGVRNDRLPARVVDCDVEVTWVEKVGLVEPAMFDSLVECEL